VVEGAEPPFLDPLAEASDLIVWCDVPFATAALRMVRRHVVADLRGQNGYPGYRRLFTFMRSVRRRYGATGENTEEPWTTWTRAQVATGAARYERKLLHLVAGSVEINLSTICRDQPLHGDRTCSFSEDA